MAHRAGGGLGPRCRPMRGAGARIRSSYQCPVCSPLGQRCPARDGETEWCLLETQQYQVSAGAGLGDLLSLWILSGSCSSPREHGPRCASPGAAERAGPCAVWPQGAVTAERLASTEFFKASFGGKESMAGTSRCTGRWAVLVRQPREVSEKHGARTVCSQSLVCVPGSARGPHAAPVVAAGGEEAVVREAGSPPVLQQAVRGEELETRVRAHRDSVVSHGVASCSEWAQQLSPISLQQSCVEEPLVMFTGHIQEGTGRAHYRLHSGVVGRASGQHPNLPLATQAGFSSADPAASAHTPVPCPQQIRSWLGFSSHRRRLSL